MPDPITFEIVEDELRTAPRQAPELLPWVQAVFEGKTVRVPLKQEKLGGYYRTFTKRGYKLRTRAAGDDTIVWCEQIVEEPAKGKK